MHEETGREGSDERAGLGSVKGHRGAGGDDGAGDVGAEDCGVVGDWREAVVALVEVDRVERDGFHFDEEFVGTWSRGWAVGDFKGGAF